MNETQLVLLLLGLVSLAVVFTFYRSQRQSAIFEKVEQMAGQVEELTLRVVTLELERSGYRLWNSQLRGQLIELGRTPIPPPPWLLVTNGLARPVTGERETGEIVVEIYHLINEYFDLTEIDDLALRAGIQSEEFGGHDSRPARARELVEYAFRHSRMAKLVEEARLLRPSVEWPPVTAAMEFKD